MTVIAFPTPEEPEEGHQPPPPGPHPWGQPRLAPMPPIDDDEDDAPAGQPVATAATYADEASWRPTTERRAIVAPWLRDGQSRRAAARWWAAHTAHVATFHGLRLPLYWLRAARRSPHGICRSLAAIGRWVIDTRSRDERDALAVAVRTDSRGAPQLENAANRHRRNVQIRLALFLTGMLGGLVGSLALLAINWAAALGTGAVALAALGVIGRPLDKPLTSWAVSKDETPRLTPDLIVAALGALGLGKLNSALKTDDRAIRFVSPVARSGDGFRVDIDMPAGVTAAEIVEKRSALASALRRHLSQVWPSPDPDAHEGRLILYVGDKPMAAQKAKPWPLATRGKVDLFEPVPVGVDERGADVTITICGEGGGLVAAIPRMGKTFILRQLALAAALDPRAKIYLYMLKGGSDGRPLKPLAHVYRVGDKPEDIKGALADLKALQCEMRRRYDLVENLPTEVCPESKVTTELASIKAHGLEPIFVGIDECQIWFEDPELGKELEAMTTDLVKRGPAVGIAVYPTTQRPDAKSLPPGIRDNVAIHICLKVNSPEANNMALGAGMYSAGYQATSFTTKDKGVAWVVGGDDPDPRICRFAFIDAPMAEAIAARAKAARERAGYRPTGMAAGEIPADSDEGPVEGVLDHVIKIWPLGKKAEWSQNLAVLLAEGWPSLYAGWEAKQVTAALTAIDGVKKEQVWQLDAEGINRNRGGFTLESLGEALERRDAANDQDGEQ